jgi:hypothetical protein
MGCCAGGDASTTGVVVGAAGTVGNVATVPGGVAGGLAGGGSVVTGVVVAGILLILIIKLAGGGSVVTGVVVAVGELADSGDV